MSRNAAGAFDPTLVATLRGGLSGATDAQLRQVVSMVDNLAQRGAVDALLGPLRPRIARLRPPRPARFTRLLFVPLDPVIVPPLGWAPGTVAMPRSALAPLAALVRAGADGDRIEAALVGHDMSDPYRLAATSASLWHMGAEILDDAARAQMCPVDWVAHGLPAVTFPGLAHLAALILRHAVAIDAVAHGPTGAGEGDDGTVEQLAARAHAEGPLAWRAVLTLLLLRARQPALVLRAATTNARLRDTAMRVAGEQAVDSALDHLARQASGFTGDPGETAERLGATTALLDAIMECSAGPERARRIGAMRTKLDTACQEMLRQGLSEKLLAPLATIGQPAPGKDAPHDGGSPAMNGLEAAARSLRALEVTGRQLGNPAPYTALLRETAARINDAPDATGITRVDRARLIELLDGPDAALAMLRASPPAHLRAAPGL